MTELEHAIETCSCGARIELEADGDSLSVRLQEWREQHRHDLAVFAPKDGSER